MKKIVITLTSVASISLLAGCESQRATDWSNNCEANYSLNRRELSECMEKVTKGVRTEIEPNTITIDPQNTNRESYDSIGKGGATDTE